MKRITLILTLIGIMTSSYSQSNLLWSEDNTAGLANYYSEYPTIESEADTIKVIGRINEGQEQRLQIVKYDLNGNVISTMSYGSDSVINNTLIDYKFDSNNHLYLLQKVKLGFYKSKIVLQKYSLDGILIWVEQIQNSADTSYTPTSLGLVNDTCIFITAYKECGYPEPGDDVSNTTSLSQLFAYNSDGDQLWRRDFNPFSELSWFAHDIFLHNDTAFFFTRNNTTLKISLIKVDVNNSLSIYANTEIPHGVNRIYLTSDNNLLLFSGANYRFSKVNKEGDTIWTKDYGTNLPSNISGDEIKNAIQDSNGNIYITGRHYGQNYGTESYTNADILTVKYDNNGNLIWQNRYEYGINNGDIGNAIKLKNGQIYVGGESQRLGVGTDLDYVVLKIDSASGELTGVYRYDGLRHVNDVVSSLLVFDNGNVALTGLSYKNSKYDWTTQLLSDVVLSVHNMSSEINTQVYPNPISNGDKLTVIGNGIISYSVISGIGQVVKQGKFRQNDLYSINLDNLSNGIFLLNLETDKGIISKKIIVR